MSLDEGKSLCVLSQLQLTFLHTVLQLYGLMVRAFACKTGLIMPKTEKVVPLSVTERVVQRIN